MKVLGIVVLVVLGLTVALGIYSLFALSGRISEQEEREEMRRAAADPLNGVPQ